jgi:hypothetical protein
MIRTSLRRRGFIALVVTAALAASASGIDGQRALGTPAERLVGHWTADGGAHYYYGSIGPSKRGTFILRDVDKDPFRREYRLVKQDKGGLRVVVELLFGDGNTREETYLIAKDGTSMETSTVFVLPSISGGMRLKDHRTYVDEKTEP